MCELCGDPNIQHLFGEQPGIQMKPLKTKLKTITLKKKRKVVTKSTE